MLAMLLALACSAADLEALQADLNDLEDEVEALEDQVDDLNAQLSDTGPLDTGPLDTGEPPPEPGEISMQLFVDNVTFHFGVELSEPADVDLFVTWTAQLPAFEESWSSASCETVELEDASRAQHWGNTLAVAEVTWPNGAWSCAQVLGYGAEPIEGCAVVQPRSVSCE